VKQVQEKVAQVEEAPKKPLIMPDLFANMRIKQPDTFFEYKKMKPEH